MLKIALKPSQKFVDKYLKEDIILDSMDFIVVEFEVMPEQ